MEKKQTAFAGSWYPASEKECESAIRQFLSDGKGPATTDFLAGIVPHAGWLFSGSIACRVIAGLAGPNDIDTIVLFGAHMHPNSQPFIMIEGRIETPLGEMEVDRELASELSGRIPMETLTPSRFPDENTLELQFPFIRYFFPRAQIVVAGVAPSDTAVAIGTTAVASAAKLNRKIRVIGSTDMTHYGPNFGFTPAGTGAKAVEWVANDNDSQAVASMTAMDDAAIISQGLTRHNMCCPGAAAATVAAAGKMGAARGICLDYATSYEKSRGDSFVGYAGILFK